ncbi:MAG TPA: hypothetical protein VHH73_14130 [Verrucomicrobiae bacterium]|nr:hypothetical protein [Verrucomicrobiae bacterium]
MGLLLIRVGNAGKVAGRRWRVARAKARPPFTPEKPEATVKESDGRIAPVERTGYIVSGDEKEPGKTDLRKIPGRNSDARKKNGSQLQSRENACGGFWWIG